MKPFIATAFIIGTLIAAWAVMQGIDQLMK